MRASILPASAAMGAAARARLERQAAPGESLGKLADLAQILAAARHDTRPSLARKSALLCAADHGVAWPGIDLPGPSPAAAALRVIAGGGAAVSAAARTAQAALVLVDAGVRGGESADLGRGVLSFRLCDGTASITAGPAMSRETADQAVETGVALVVSLAEGGVDVLALGQIGTGGEVAAGALCSALTGAAPANAAGHPGDAVVIGEALAANAAAVAGGDPLAILAALGGPELGLLAGAILAAASLHIPVVLDDQGTWAAALVAVRLVPAAAGYLIASHAGGHPERRGALSALGLEPLFDLGLAHGEGTGALLALPLLDAAARALAA